MLPKFLPVTPPLRPNYSHLLLRSFAQVVALGVDAYLQMLLRDNFVHTDLHPGNILVRSSPQVCLPLVYIKLHSGNILVRSSPQVGLPFVHTEPHPGTTPVRSSPQVRLAVFAHGPAHNANTSEMCLLQLHLPAQLPKSLRGLSALQGKLQIFHLDFELEEELTAPHTHVSA